MLWKRVSNQPDSLLIDICEESEYSIFDSSSVMDESKRTLEKSNDLSNHYRMKGSQEVEAKNWFEAIEFFNQALCFAESGSIEMANAFANRASCFLQLKMYEECLTDIKLAKTNECPPIILPKLSKMAATCGQKKQQPRNDAQTTQQFTPTLSFKPSKEYPCAANVIRFGKTKDSHRFVEATRQIDVGQTILIENGFVSSTIERYKRCCICLKSIGNFVPCKDCTDTLLCYGTCEKSDLHSVECNTTSPSNGSDDDDDDDEVDYRLVIRSILIAFQIFPNINELDRYVDRVLFDKNFEVNDTDLSPKAKYAVFLKNGRKLMRLADEDGEYLMLIIWIS